MAPTKSSRSKKTPKQLDAEIAEWIADEWAPNVNGVLKLHEGLGGEWWIWRVKSNGEIRETIGPFRSKERAQREMKYLATRTAGAY